MKTYSLGSNVRFIKLILVSKGFFLYNVQIMENVVSCHITNGCSYETLRNQLQTEIKEYPTTYDASETWSRAMQY